MQKALIALTLGVLTVCPALGQTRNPREVAEVAMMKADRDFNQAAADRDLPRFLALVADDAKFDSADALGKDAVGKAWAPFFEANGPRISWAPTKAEALVAGDVGYTVGTWERRTKDARGIEIVRHGQYMTAWKKQKDGVWRVQFDFGSTSPEGARTRPLTR